MTPRKIHKYSAGLGGSTDEGLRGRLKYNNRRLNTAGHRLNIELRSSLIEQRFLSAYEIPRAHPVDETLSLQVGIRREDLNVFNTAEAQVGLTETKRRPWGWLETRFISVKEQSFDVASDNRTTTLILPGLRWTKRRSDDPLYPLDRYAISFEIRGSANALVSDVDFARTLLSIRAVYGLPQGIRLLTRTELGASWVENFRALPPSERFFAGGDTSIRGYALDDLGPVDNSRRVVGGKYLAVASVEVEKFVSESWGLALFCDAGNAFGGSGQNQEVKLGIGLGVRWRSPIGPVGIDLAHPLDDDSLARIHLRIGGEF